eukprot:scaffold5034_cov385-Prasinococcus_capsulatus_cf.AAC.10
MSLTVLAVSWKAPARSGGLLSRKRGGHRQLHVHRRLWPGRGCEDKEGVDYVRNTSRIPATTQRRSPRSRRAGKRRPTCAAVYSLVIWRGGVVLRGYLRSPCTASAQPGEVRASPRPELCASVSPGDSSAAPLRECWCAVGKPHPRALGPRLSSVQPPLGAANLPIDQPTASARPTRTRSRQGGECAAAPRATGGERRPQTTRRAAARAERARTRKGTARVGWRGRAALHAGAGLGGVGGAPPGRATNCRHLLPPPPNCSPPALLSRRDLREAPNAAKSAPFRAPRSPSGGTFAGRCPRARWPRGGGGGQRAPVRSLGPSLRPLIRTCSRRLDRAGEDPCPLSPPPLSTGPQAEGADAERGGRAPVGQGADATGW